MIRRRRSVLIGTPALMLSVFLLMGCSERAANEDAEQRADTATQTQPNEAATQARQSDTESIRAARALLAERVVLYNHILGFACADYFHEGPWENGYFSDDCPATVCYKCARVINPECSENYQLQGSVQATSSEISYRCRKQGGGPATPNALCEAGFQYDPDSVTNNRYDCQSVPERRCLLDHWLATSLELNFAEASYSCWGQST